MNLPPGTTLYIGPPANPLPPETQAKIAFAISGVSGILRHIFHSAMPKALVDPSAQILPLALEPGVTPGNVMPQVQENMRAALPPGKFIDIFPVAPNHPMLPTVRQTNTKLVI